MYVVKLWDSLHSHLSLHSVQTHRVFINRLPLCTRVLIYANMNLKTHLTRCRHEDLSSKFCW